MCKLIDLNDYKNIAIAKKMEYILDVVPSNSKTKTKGWRCKCGHLREISYQSMKVAKNGCLHCKK